MRILEGRVRYSVLSNPISAWHTLIKRSKVRLRVDVE